MKIAIIFSLRACSRHLISNVKIFVDMFSNSCCCRRWAAKSQVPFDHNQILGIGLVSFTAISQRLDVRFSTDGPLRHVMVVKL